MEEDIKEILTALDNTTKKQLDEAIANADKEWSEMELEEDIKILEELIKYYEKELSSVIINDSYRWCCERNKKAIEHLIARNKELEANQCVYKDTSSCTKALSFEAYTKLSDFIPKSKVREKIEELEKYKKEISEEKDIFYCEVIRQIRLLQELLEDNYNHIPRID